MRIRVLLAPFVPNVLPASNLSWQAAAKVKLALLRLYFVGQRIAGATRDKDRDTKLFEAADAAVKVCVVCGCVLCKCAPSHGDR